MVLVVGCCWWLVWCWWLVGVDGCFVLEFGCWWWLVGDGGWLLSVVGW